MTVYCSPFGPKPQFEIATGVPAVGYQLFFYVAGSVNTKQNTYTDSTGGVPNANPIALNALGQPANEIWFTSGQTYKVVLAPPTDTDPPTSPVWSIDNLAGINDVSISGQSQWVAGPTPTYVSATSFTLVGDQTSNFTKGRRLQTTISAGTSYSTIVNSAYGAVTTVTVANDSTALDAGLSAVNYGLMSAVNPSIDADMVDRKGTAVVSAATTDIWSIAGNTVHITGSTGPITSFGTAPYAGARRIVVFDSTPTVTYNATSLMTPGKISFTAQAGSVAAIFADTTANMQVEWLSQGFSAAAKLPRSSLGGFAVANNGSDATNDIDFAVGECRDSTNACDMIALTAMTKQLDVAWAAGTNAGGRMSVAAIANTTYHCYVIRKDSDGTCDFGYDTSASAPTMPAGYTYFRLIFSIVRSGGAIKAFLHTGDLVQWLVPVSEINAGTLSTANRTNVTLGGIPTGRKLTAILGYAHAGTAAVANITVITDPDITDTAAGLTTGFNGMGSNQASTADYGGQVQCMTNTSAQVATRGNVALTYYLNTHAYIDRRGRDT